MSRTHQKQNGFTIIELLFSTAIFSTVLMLCLAALVQIGRMYYKGVTTSQTQEAARGVLDELTQAIQLSSGKVKAPMQIDGTSMPPGPVYPVQGSSLTQGDNGFFCVGTTRYSYALDRKQSPDKTNVAANKEIRHALWADEPPICANANAYGDITPGLTVDLTADEPLPSIAGKPAGRDLLGDNMRLTRLRIFQPAGSVDNSVWQIQLTVAYGDDDILVLDDNGTPSDTTDDRRFCKGASIGTQFCAFSELTTIVKRRIL